MSFETVIILAVALLTLTASAFRWPKRLTRARARADRRVAAVYNQSINIRRMAKQTLAQRRQYRALGRRGEALVGQCDLLATEIGKLTRIDGRIHVLDDRRTRADRDWIAVLSHQDYGGIINPKATSDVVSSWRYGRRFIVWAVDSDRARDKINSAMPPEKGFVITSLQQQ